MTSRFTRLVHTGNVMLDVVLRVPALPARGGDVVATGGGTTTGAGFNVMAAAARLGLRTVYAGLIGTGPRADRATADLTAEGIEILAPAVADCDTGFVTVLIEPDGERSFVSSFGAELDPRRPDLRALLVADDAVYISGYSLGTPEVAGALTALLTSRPAGSTVVFDPGPLVESIPAATLSTVLENTDILTCNAVEEKALVSVGVQDRLAADALAVVRHDRDGAVVTVTGGAPRAVPAVPVEVVDANGAGDAHTGALLAALARGEDPIAAVEFANAAAAFAVSRPGPATGPTTAELSRFRAARPDPAPSRQS